MKCKSKESVHEPAALPIVVLRGPFTLPAVVDSRLIDWFSDWSLSDWLSDCSRSDWFSGDWATGDRMDWFSGDCAVGERRDWFAGLTPVLSCCCDRMVEFMERTAAPAVPCCAAAAAELRPPDGMRAKACCAAAAIGASPTSDPVLDGSWE